MGLGNLLGTGGGSNPLGLGSGKGVQTGSGVNKRIRKVDVAKGVRGIAFRKAVRKRIGGELSVQKIEKVNGKRTIKNVKLEKKEVEEFIRDRFLEEVGRKSTVSSLKRRLKKNQGFVKNGVRYKIGGSRRNIEKRGEIGDLLAPDGPTRKALELQDKKEIRKKRRNVLSSVQSGEEAERRINSREDPRAALKKNVENSRRITDKETKYTIGGEEFSTGTARKDNQIPGSLNEGFSGQDKSANASLVQGSEGAASVAGGIGSKPQGEEDLSPLDNNIMP
jgi:hypothetical protein